MGMDSFVNGYIVGAGGRHGDEANVVNRQALSVFTFDEKFPFTNIFWPDSPACYGNRPVIAFAGCYKQIEEAWAEWMWKFSQLLSTLEAVDARVHLDCVRGYFSWRLQPKSVYLAYQLKQSYPATLHGESWGVVEAPDPDPLLNPHPGDNTRTLWNAETHKYDQVIWSQRIARWTK